MENTNMDAVFKGNSLSNTTSMQYVDLVESFRNGHFINQDASIVVYIYPHLTATGTPDDTERMAIYPGEVKPFVSTKGTIRYFGYKSASGTPVTTYQFLD